MISILSSTLRICCLCAALALTMVGCIPVYYRPTKAIAPSLTEKGQFSFAISTPANSQLAFSPVNHVGIVAGYSAFNTSGEDVVEKAHLLEVGGGYYYCIPLSNGKREQKMVFDVYGTYGRGMIDIEKPYDYPSMHISKYVIQPGFCYRSKYFETSVNWRFADVRYDYSSVPFSTANRIYPQARTNYFFLEPALTIRGGYKGIKLELQWVHTVKWTYVPWNADTDVLSIGAYVIVGGFRKTTPRGGRYK